MEVTTDIRVRSALSDTMMERRIGKLPGQADFDLLLTGPAKVTLMSGRTLCVYLPGVLNGHLGMVYPVLHELRKIKTDNRGDASGSKRTGSGRKPVLGGSTHDYALPVPSAILGSTGPMGQRMYCRQTAWTGTHLPEWERLNPLLREVASHFRQHVPVQFAEQEHVARNTKPEWRVPGTPFTTVTVNNSYATGCHKDKGDLGTGFSALGVNRQGFYTGGQLVFPQYRVAVDMMQGDLLLMDAHEWHGNCQLWCQCGTRMRGYCQLCEAERISLVCYYRENLMRCGTPAQELKRAEEYHDRNERARLAKRQA